MSQTGNLIEQIKKELARFDGVSSISSVKLSEDDDVYTVNIGIDVYYGTNIPQLCYDIQTGLIRDAEYQSGIEISTVNIRVEGINER